MGGLLTNRRVPCCSSIVIEAVSGEVSIRTSHHNYILILLLLLLLPFYSALIKPSQHTPSRLFHLSHHQPIPSTLSSTSSPISFSISMRAPSPPRHYNPIYTTPYYNYNPYSLPYYPLSTSTTQLTAAEKRQKLEQDFENGFPDDGLQTLDFPPHLYTAMPQQSVRPVPVNPHISLQRASEPTSPITVATSISTHSTPVSSPSRVAIMSADNSPQDFQLYDDGFPISADQKSRINRRYESASPFGSRNTNASPIPHSRFSSGAFNIVVPQADSSAAQPGLQPFYPEQPQHYLQAPAQQFGNQGLPMARSKAHHHSDDEELPALSPHHQSQFSSRLSASDVDLHSPTTPIASPDSANGEGCGASVPAVREDACEFLESWMMDQYLLVDYSEIHTPVPKLGPRTISDAMQDELYNPGVAPGTAHAIQQQAVCTTPSQVSFLYQQAQKQHTMACATPPLARDSSPFRANSPFHPARGAQFPVPPSPSRSSALLAVGFSTARAQREQEAEIERAALQRQMEEDYKSVGEAPKTISPKDAYLEYHEPSQEGIKGSLFVTQEDEFSQNGSVHSGSYKSSVHEDDEDAQTEQSYSLKREESYGSMATSRRESDASMNFATPIFPSNGNQQFASIDFPYSYSGHTEEASDPTTQQSMVEDEGDYDYQPASSPLSKPAESKANRGGYTCTVPGCTQRFPTTNKMAKHRREAHRQTTPGSRGDGIARSHHPGPHRCNRINPTTNKPCNTVFSRPYDLTRHEDTIHNTHREKVRCEICNDEKTFSRQDALTRHKKVIHPLINNKSTKRPDAG